MKKLIRWYNSTSIRTKMTLLFVIMSIIPACVLGTVSLKLYSQNLEQNGVQESHTYLEFLDYRLDQNMYDIHKTVLLTAYDDSISDYFDPACSISGEEREEMLRMVQRELINLRLREKAHSVILVGQDKGALIYSLADFASVRYVEQLNYQVLGSEEFEIYDSWADPIIAEGEAVVPYERIVLSRITSEPVARLVVNYPEASFAQFYEDYEKKKGTNFFVLNSDGQVLSSSNKDYFACDIQDVLDISSEQIRGKSGSFHTNGMLITYFNNDRRDYTLLECIPLSVFSSMFHPVLMVMLTIAVISIAVCLLLGTVLSRSVTKPLYALIDRVSSDRTSASHAGARKSQNEIAILSESFDGVVDRLEILIGEYYEEQRKKKEAQIRALEFQINPHFLYNTLSTIIWLIDAGEGERAIEITQDLSMFFRISISKGRDFIKLRDEVKHVQLYIDIQKARYQDMIFVTFDVPEELLDYETPKLLLQPLVENSIIHAMQTRHDKVCHIVIRARLEEGAIVLYVEDDGETATEESIAAMNNFLRDRTSVPAGSNYGIGISNVHDRIYMSFGEGYGLNYQRIDGKTIARLRIKAREGGNAGV
ncbi:MAG: histidine kinase [Clostridia bacterium]|nr:histidine kinase [Clostridia bacterium]